MTIDASVYELVARADGRRRAGSLLRVTFDDEVRGYADVHPWPELGDALLDRQLASLATGSFERIAARSVEIARGDGVARAEGRSLFDGLTVPPSHASLPFGFTAHDLSRAAAEGYDRVKLKGWIYSPEEIRILRQSGLKVRLDFNARLSGEEVRRLLDDWGDLDWIDWLEDPCPYDPDVWSTLRNRVRLAIDFEEGDEGFDVRIVKPARGGIVAPDSPRSTIHDPQAFTSYLDHPVGQLGAAWCASKAVEAGVSVEPGGLVTHEVYEPTQFSRQLGVEKARLVPPGGPGLGFGAELEGLEWRRIKE